MREEAPDKKQQIAGKLVAFIARYRVALLAILIVVAVAVLALFVTLAIRESRLERAYAAAESLQDSYAAWVSSDEAEGGAEALLAEAGEVSERFAKGYAAARAHLIAGSVHEELEQYAEAADAFVQVAQTHPDSYLAPVGLMRGAVAYENADDIESAREALEELVGEYGESADAPRALFSLGRLSEGAGRIAEAAQRYDELIERFPSSGWTNFARDRIILFTAQGLIGE